MKKIPVLMLAVLLAACGGKSDTAASQADAGLPPKPSGCLWVRRPRIRPTTGKSG